MKQWILVAALIVAIGCGEPSPEKPYVGAWFGTAAMTPEDFAELTEGMDPDQVDDTRNSLAAESASLQLLDDGTYALSGRRELSEEGVWRVVNGEIRIKALKKYRPNNMSGTLEPVLAPFEEIINIESENQLSASHITVRPHSSMVFKRSK